MKGAPPRPSYLVSLLPLLARAGATDLLIEYEDMVNIEDAVQSDCAALPQFPYWGPLANIASLAAWSREDIAVVVQAAAASGLGIIPLIQVLLSALCCLVTVLR